MATSKKQMWRFEVQELQTTPYKDKGYRLSEIGLTLDMVERRYPASHGVYA